MECVLFDMSDSPTAGSFEAEVRAFLDAADAAWRAGGRPDLPEAVKQCDHALARLKAEPDNLEVNSLRAEVFLKRGQALEALNTGEALTEALRGYEQVISGLRRTPGAPGGLMALAWMNRGNVLQRAGQPEALQEAVRCYDQTLALLGKPEAEDAPDFVNTIGAAWMNRGMAAQRLGTPEGRQEALRSLDEALAMLEPLIGEHPQARRNFASASMNRGLILLQQGQLEAGVAAQARAVAELTALVEAAPDGERELGRLDLAAMKLNLAQGRAANGDAEGGLAVLREALAGVLPAETSDPRAMETALRLRHAGCVILGAWLSTGGDKREEWLEEAGDWVEDGLAAAAGWGQNARWFRASSARLFEFGAWLYRTQQPQFLVEFLEEHLGDGDEMRRKIALNAVGLARQEIMHRGLTTLAGDDVQKIAERIETLRTLEARLQAMAPAPEPTPSPAATTAGQASGATAV